MRADIAVKVTVDNGDSLMVEAFDPIVTDYFVSALRVG